MISPEERSLSVPDWAPRRSDLSSPRGSVFEWRIRRTTRPQVLRGTPFPTANTYYGGDFAGLTGPNWPILKNSGVKSFISSPVFRSPIYHKYDISDYETIEAIYGVFRKGSKLLVDAAQSPRIRVILDGVFNHALQRHILSFKTC